SVTSGSTLKSYRVLAKRCLILLEANAPQPDHDVHDTFRKLRGVVQRGPAPEGVSSRVATQQPDGAGARLPFKVHAHMLRHACGYALAMRGTTRGQFKRPR